MQNGYSRFYLKNKEIEKKAEYYQQFKIKCKYCGRRRAFKPNEEEKICLHCGRLIFKSERAEFNYKLKNKIKEFEKNDSYK